MTFLLDTTAISEPTSLLPDAGALGWLAERQSHELFTSVLCIGEVRRGISLLAHSARRTRLETWLDGDVVPGFEDRLLPVTLDVAERWGSLVARLQRGGQAPPLIDSLIAATALVHDLSVVTHNTADFERCGIDVVNPWSA